ncbi:MAG: hypothetical protein A3K19_29880 [Lentisphaerae bacterium RIFOXYB12_FULL_65_16]|nr:MAG: hypothetical protein A3K18_33490 [Lentisphaerae bacterium RIFOXYA12_64_32]OGV86538.1 MAG: hypothetical protein A3K19_29880 [Lentisphaerae bacterium RIFOXYB12_FULL_65_16]
MFGVGDVIDGKYRVRGICSSAGGMGTIVHVDPVTSALPYAIVLKYCKEPDPEAKARFSREVRYLADFAGNSMVLQVLDSNLTMDPPYFVMKYYADGDLSRLAVRIQGDPGFQESMFNKMLDCISELHARRLQHRDIKPQNFLVDGEAIVVSDLGLAKEVGAGTTFTVSHQYWGSHGYLPPEFLTGGFKAATPPSDIFMLGKTFYTILTGRDPVYLAALGVHPAVFYVIERCCDLNPANRYSTIAELKQALRLAYDVVLARAKGMGTARQALSQIVTRLSSERKYVVDEITGFLDLMAMLQEDERSALMHELPGTFYYVLAQQPIESRLRGFLDQYAVFSRAAVQTFSYAETVADNMKAIFDRSSVPGYRAKALDIAIDAAELAHRFAAMDTCKEMITSVADDELGIAVAAVLARHRGTFVDGIETSRCHSDAVGNAILAGRRAV